MGGLSVIAAVLGMLVFLLAVVRPLFSGAVVTEAGSVPILPPDRTADLLFVEVDEYRRIALAALRDGEILALDLRDGSVLERFRGFPAGVSPTAFARGPEGGGAAFGFADGTVRLARIEFPSRAAGAGALAPRPLVTVEDPVAVGSPGDAVILLDLRESGSDSRLAVLTASGALSLGEVTRRTNLLTGERTEEISSTPLPIPDDLRERGSPSFLRITARGDQLLLAWSDGFLARWDMRDPANPLLAERTDLTEPSGVRLTAIRFMQGDQSILSGDSSGGVRGWYRVERWGGGLDGRSLVAARTPAGHAAPVDAIAVSSRDKTFATGAADGSIALHHLTSARTLARARVDPASPVAAIQIAPKVDAIVAVTADGRLTQWDLDAPHPETTWSTLFGRVWYEGYPGPAFTWQSSSGTDDFEPKLSLVPLVFGTMKATLYSMLFAVPIAVTAALYTSEFLDRRFRAPIKAAVEMMASLPSVVLGFIAALVLAPLVERWVVAVLTAFAIVPLAAILAGHLSRHLPLALRGGAGRGAPWTQILFLTLLVLLSAAAARGLAPFLEWWLFAGDFKAWLDGRAGTGAAGIGLLCWPPILVALIALDARRSPGGRASGARLPAGATRWLAVVALSIAGACLIGWLGGAMGVDPRPLLFGTYVQRNALVVGFVMGFAVIPIIYTVAEDALSAVPDTLRSASLGCGASRWQTAVRIVLPVAIPGIFSALMIGLGRAAGETMIVLMAAGNTPVLDLNVFNGLRTLSANIAVELPEAVKDGTLYRVLFLAALMLFAITFVVNTLAELVRQRFRRRSASL